LGDKAGIRVSILDMPRKALKCKGWNSGDKGHHKPTKDTKKKPYKKELHPKTLVHKSLSKPFKKNFKKQKNKKKPNQEKKKHFPIMC